MRVLVSIFCDLQLLMQHIANPQAASRSLDARWKVDRLPYIYHDHQSQINVNGNDRAHELTHIGALLAYIVDKYVCALIIYHYFCIDQPQHAAGRLYYHYLIVRTFACTEDD
jgi:hypothetical protein